MLSRMTPSQLIAEAKKLLAECTPGPWCVSPDGLCWKPVTSPLVDVNNLENVRHIPLPDRSIPDAEFLAFCRNHLPDLIALVERQESALEETMSEEK